MEDFVDQDFEAEREKIEERHRNEILNLLKSFEFEKKDIEARLRQELESKESEEKQLDEKVETRKDEIQDLSQSDVLELQEKWQSEKEEEKAEFEKEKEELLLKISELESGTQREEKSDDGLTSAVAESEAVVSPENRAGGVEDEKLNQRCTTLDEMQHSESNTADTKSLSELEKDNKQLEEDSDKSKEQILQLKNQVKHLTQRFQDIEKLFEDSDIPSDKRDALTKLLTGSPSNVTSSHDVVQSPSDSPSAHEKSFDDIDTTLSGDKLNRTNSMLSFQLQELNFENEDLKRNFCELEQKLRKTVEENEIKVNVFNERLTGLVEKIMSGETSETTQESGFKMSLVEEINNIRMEKTSNELLEEHVGIVLRQKLTACSPDIPDVNFCHALQSLEQILDIEIFEGRVFDSEMKDEVKQVLRDKERELLVAYTLDKLRDEIRHRAATEGTLEELQKERERDFCVHEAVNEVLKGHLGISYSGSGHDDNDNQGIDGAPDDHKQAVNIVLREHLGMENEGDKVIHSDPSDVNGETRSGSTEVESLKAEKENLEKNLQELQDYFEKERQAWLEKLRSPLQGGSSDPEDKDKVIQTLRAQKVLMEQILNTERFHLSRLYYMEMKEDLETCLKQHQFDRSTKLEKERLVDAWKHHAEVGDLYQEILSKESENLQNLQANIQEENKPENDGENDPPHDELNRELSKLKQQLPVKRELLELQRKRCRDHKATSLILEQAVAALETAAQEQDTLLVSGNYFQRKSSCSSIEENEEVEGPDIQKEISQDHQEEIDSKHVPSPNTSSELVENSSRKDVLADDLVKLFEKLLRGQPEKNDPQLDSCTSDSEQSEVETLSGQDPPSDDEVSIKKDNSENEEDGSSTNTSPRPTKAEPEDHSENKPDPSVPVIFKLPPRIENVLNIERFNMSRLLRHEYIDKIRRGREKLRRAKAKKEEKNGELASKFKEEVKALLEGMELGEIGEVERILPQQRRKLTATPSYDSGIVDPTEQDKDEVVKKYKELLEKARRDLNRAHRALKARSSGGEDMREEIAAIKRSAKETQNDLDELEEKRSDLDLERDHLLGKIKDVRALTSLNDEGQTSDAGHSSKLEREDEMPLKGDPSESVLGNQVSVDENNIADGNSGSSKRLPEEGEMAGKDLEKRLKDMENKVEKLREEKMSGEEEVKELQRKLVAGTGGEEILTDLHEQLTAAHNERSNLEDKCSELEREMLVKDDKFEAEMKEKEAEVNELQRKLVSGTEGDDILKEMQKKLDNVRDEKLAVEEKCFGLEEKVNEKEEKLKSIEGEIEVLERKSVEGTGAEEIVAKLQEKLNNPKMENAKEEEKCDELVKEVKEKNKELKRLKECHQNEVDELQKELVAGTGGEKILEDLKKQLREATEQNGSLKERNSELEEEMEKKLEDEKKELQRKVVAGTGGEEILTELQEKLDESKKQNHSLEENISDLEKQVERKEKIFSEDVKKLEDEINDLQRKLVSGTGGEEILHDLQGKLKETQEKNSCLEKKNSDLEKENENRERKMEDEINNLQRKLLAGSGGEELLEGLQEKIRQEKDEKMALQRKCEELEDKAKAKGKEFSEEIERKDDEINKLQTKLVGGAGGEEILAELQDKLGKEKEEKAVLQKQCKEQEDKLKTKEKEFNDEIKGKDDEINELQKKLVSGTGGEQLLVELQDKLEKEKEDKAKIRRESKVQEDKLKAKGKELKDQVEEKENEISELQKKLVSGTGGEEILPRLQAELEKAKVEKCALQTRCEELEDKRNARNKNLNDEIKQKDNEINELQKKLVGGTGGEQVLAELQEQLQKEKDEKVALQTHCKELEDEKKKMDKDFSDEIKEKDSEIAELQKKLMSGTGGEEILAELQDELGKEKEEKANLQRESKAQEDKLEAKDRELNDHIEEKENEINELQKKLVSGVGGEKILAELKDKLKQEKDEKIALQTRCEELEEQNKANDKEFRDEIKEKDHEINELQKKLVSGTGGEEILAELQDKLEKAKEEKTVLQSQCEEKEDKLVTKDKEFNSEIKEKDNEINGLQKKLDSGTGREEIFAELQDKLEKAKNEKCALQAKCEELEEVKLKDNKLRNQKNENAQEVNDLQTKLFTGTGSEEVLAELQNKVKKAEERKEMLAEKCSKLEEKLKKKDVEAMDEKTKKDEEIDKLQRRLLSGTGGEEILEELKFNLKEAKKENERLEKTCAGLEKDLEIKEVELQEKDEEIIDLQTKIIDGTGGEDLLKELQGNLKDVRESEKKLQKRCSGLEKDLQEKEKKFADNSKCKQNEIEDLQRKLVSGSGGEEVLLDLQDKLNQSNQEKVLLESKVVELEKDMEGMDDKFAEKQEEVNQLQRDLIEGTGAEDILVDLQDKLAVANKESKKLETKCHELEKQRNQRNLDGDNEKELKNLKAADKVLRNENKAKQQKVNELQLKMLEGTGGEDVLKELQNDLNDANERNKALEIRNAELEEERSEGLQNNIAALMEENRQLEEASKAVVTKLEDLRKSVVNGTGSEELLQQLQDEIRKISSENQDLQNINRAKEDIRHGGNDSQRLEKELRKVNLEKGRLAADNERKESEIADLQNKLVAGSGGEELLADLQEEIKRVKQENEEIVSQLDDLKETNMGLTDEAREKKKIENSLLRENKKLLEEKESKDNELRELQRSIAEGTGAEDLVKTLQDKIKETANDNKILVKKCSDLESNAVELLEDKDVLEQKVIESDEAKNEIEKLALDCEEKDREIVELQRKLVAGTGGEEILEDLQTQIKNLQELNKDLERKLLKNRKDRRAPDSLEKRGKKIDKKAPNRVGLQRTDDKSTGNRFSLKINEKDDRSMDNADKYSDENETFADFSHRNEAEGKDNIDEPVTYEQCLQMISETNEEKDFWKEKFEALRRKVGEQFVDIIPDVWNKETELEKQREEILSQLSDLRHKISERETPVIKTVSEKERIETELSEVESDLKVCSENLKQLRDMQNEEKLIGKNEGKLAQCLHELGLKTESLQQEVEGGALMVSEGNDTEALERKLGQLCNEATELLAEEQGVKRLQGKEEDIAVQKIDIENEIQKVEAAIDNLQKGFIRQNDLNRPYSSSRRNIEGLKNQHGKTEEITNELAKVQHEINELQSSLETPASSSGHEVNNLLALMKEKSKLEDELADTEKSLNQVGKREFEALVKERQRHEKVAKTLLELSREKETAQGELQGLEALVQEKESELLKSISAELKKDKEALDTDKKKGKRFKKRKSSLEIESEEPGAVSSVEEGFSDIDLDEPILSSDATLALSEELGSLIQKKSSLAIRVEDLGKKITAQSLKVEKSLLGAKDDASGEQPLGESFVSVEDLTLSQMSIFDDYNMVDELSLATSIVGDERVKRKASRNAPMSKLLKEKSALEKKLKDSQGKVLVQNTKVKNALKENKDGGKAKEKFVQAVHDRKVIEDELSNVCRKIDELASEEFPVKRKKAKTSKRGKSLSKNDKRRLLSQRESLDKQLDAIKTKIENFSLDGEDAGLADFPEMREAESIGNRVERLRELLAREAELKQELDRLAAKEDDEGVSSRTGRDALGETLSRSGKVGRRSARKGDIEGSSMTSEGSAVTSEFSGITSDSSGLTSEASGMTSDSSAADEGAGVTMDSDRELVKRSDEDGLTKDIVDTSHAGTLDESKNKGILKEIFRDLGNQVKGLSSGEEDYRSVDKVTKRETKVKSDKNSHGRDVSSVEIDTKDKKIAPGASQGPDSKDTDKTAEQGDEILGNSPSYPEVIDLLLKEKATKEARLRDLEKEIEDKESDGDKTKETDIVRQMKRDNLHHKMQLALNELQQRKEALEESKNLLRKRTNVDDPEKILEDSHIVLTKQKDNLETELAVIKNEMDEEAKKGEDLEGISTEYQVYKDMKDKEKDLVKELDETNEKLHKRKEWSALDSPGEEVNAELAEIYADISKRMSDENLNMADLIHELEETKETLSREREITSELLDLIKSRVGNELLEALMAQGLQSPSVEIREIALLDGQGHQDLVDKVENETVTVAEVIDEYKKINQLLSEENQKIHEKMDLLKTKVDEDLFASIVGHESVDVEISKKNEISKILENNKTLFDQIVSNGANENEKVVRNMEDEILNLQSELEGVRKRDEKDKGREISKELDDTNERKRELEQKLKGKTFHVSGEEHKCPQAEAESYLNEFNKSQNGDELVKEMDGSMERAQKLKKIGVREGKTFSDTLKDIEIEEDLTEEGGESSQIDQDEVFQKINEEGDESGNRDDIELEREIFSEKMAETEAKIPGSVFRQEARKGGDGLGSELKKDYENQDVGGGDSEKHEVDDKRICGDDKRFTKEEVNKGQNENLSSVENLQKRFGAKLDEIQDLQKMLKNDLDEKELEHVAKKEDIQPEKNVLHEKLENDESSVNNLKKEHEALKSDFEKQFHEACKERDEIKGEFENLQKDNRTIKERLGSTESKKSELEETIAGLENDKEELTNNLNESEKTVDEAKELLNLLKEENAEMKGKNDNVEHENEQIKTKLTEADHIQKKLKKVVEGLETEKTALQDEISSLEKEKVDMNEVIRTLKNEKEEGIVKLNEINETLKDNEEKSKTVQDLDGDNESLQKALDVLEKENKELNDKIIGLQNENVEVNAKLDEAREAIKDNYELTKTLQDLETKNKSLKEALDSFEIENQKMNEKVQEHESTKETLSLLEKENNEIISRVEELSKSKKELEDEVEYLLKEYKDFESLNEKLKDAEVKQENVEKELEVLSKERKEIEDFVREDLNQDTENGIKSALETFKEIREKNNAERKALKEDAENLRRLQNIVGDNLSKTLIDLATEGLVFNDTDDNPKCLGSLVNDNKSLANILNQYESELAKVRQHLGENLLSIVIDKDSDEEESEKPLKIADELKNGKNLKEIIQEYEDLINSQADSDENIQYLQEKVDILESKLEAVKNIRDNVLVKDDVADRVMEDVEDQNEPEIASAEKHGAVKRSQAGLLPAAEEGDENLKPSEGYKDDSLMDIDYQDLLKKVIDHQAEIEEAEQLLQTQTAKHEADKQDMIKQFNTEKTSMQELINKERGSMEKAMQNLINEIVRLKEERNEIRKNNRIEKEKLVFAFDNERAELLSKNEERKNEVEVKLEKKFQDDLEKVAKEMEARESELKEELMKLKTERNDLASKVVEMEDKIGREVIGIGGIEKTLVLKERESKEQIKNEFEEKMNVEKKRFQETLNSLRQDIERLQKEKSKAMSEISRKQEDITKQSTDVSRNEAVIYDRLESEFKAKMNTEKMLMEGRIKELRKENEVLSQQKQELKSSMRIERLELSKKYEQEKEELAEKYRNELKTLKKNLEKTATHETSTVPTQAFYEFRRKIRDRDTKIKRYETFFKELNQEASMLQRDSDLGT